MLYRCHVSLSLDDFSVDQFNFDREQILFLKSFNIINRIDPIADILLEKWINKIAIGNLDHKMVVEYLLSYFQMCKQFIKELKLDAKYVNNLISVMERIEGNVNSTRVM